MIPKEHLKNLCKTTYAVNWYESDLDVIRSFIAALPEAPTEGEMYYWVEKAYNKALTTTVTDLSTECKTKYATPVTAEMKTIFAETIVIDLLAEYFKNGCCFPHLKMPAAAPPAAPLFGEVAPAAWDNIDLFVQPARVRPRPVARRAAPLGYAAPPALRVPRFDPVLMPDDAQINIGANAIQRMREAIQDVMQEVNIAVDPPPENHD